VDECQRDAGRQTTEADREVAARRGQHDVHEQRREHDLHEHRRHDPVAAGAVLVPAVGGEVVLAAEAVDVVGDGVDDEPADRRADELPHPVERGLGPGQLAGQDHAQRDGGVDVATGHVADGVGHDQEAEAEGQGDPEDADAIPGQDGATGATEHEHRRSDHFGGEDAGVVDLHTQTSSMWRRDPSQADQAAQRA
jgi:hypothetical protein